MTITRMEQIWRESRKFFFSITVFTALPPDWTKPFKSASSPKRPSGRLILIIFIQHNILISATSTSASSLFLGATVIIVIHSLHSRLKKVSSLKGDNFQRCSLDTRGSLNCSVWPEVLTPNTLSPRYWKHSHRRFTEEFDLKYSYIGVRMCVRITCWNERTNVSAWIEGKI